MTRAITFLLGTVPLWLAGGALAQTTPDAAALRDGLNDMLKPILTVQVQQQPLFTGPVTVESSGSGTTVVFPGIDLTLKSSQEKGPKSVALRCDAQTYRATSTGTATWRLESSEPLNCVAQPEGEARVTLTNRAFQAHFVVDLGQKLFTESEWRAGDTTIAQDGQPGKVTIDTLSVTSLIRPASDPARHDVAFKMEAGGFSAFDDQGVERFTLGHAVYDGTMDGMDVQQVMATTGEVLDVYAEMIDTIIPSAQPADPKQAVAAQAELMQKVMGPIKRMMAAYGSGAQIAATITDLRVKAPEVQVTLDRLRLAEGYDGAATPKGTGMMEIGMAGLALAPKPPFAQWIPTDATIRLDASSIPWADVGTAYMKVMDASAIQIEKPDEAQQQIQQAMMEIGGILRQAGSRLDLTSFTITAPEAAIDLGGAVQGKDAAAHGVTADLDLRITNLDGLIKFLQGMPGGAETAAGLSMAQVMGRQATTDDGRPARDYDIVVDDAGKILVNGTDLAAMMPKK